MAGRRRGIEGSPASYVVAGEWPDGRVEGHVAAGYVQVIVQRLRDATRLLSARQVAERADLQHRTVLRLLAGETWPDVVTVAKLEDAFDVVLWPSADG